MSTTRIGKVSPTIEGMWDAKKSYDELCFVEHEDSLYISREPVPAGTSPTDSMYWYKMPGGARGLDDVQIDNESVVINGVAKISSVDLVKTALLGTDMTLSAEESNTVKTKLGIADVPSGVVDRLDHTDAKLDYAFGLLDGIGYTKKTVEARNELSVAVPGDVKDYARVEEIGGKVYTYNQVFPAEAVYTNKYEGVWSYNSGFPYNGTNGYPTDDFVKIIDMDNTIAKDPARAGHMIYTLIICDSASGFDGDPRFWMGRDYFSFDNVQEGVHRWICGTDGLNVDVYMSGFELTNMWDEEEGQYEEKYEIDASWVCAQVDLTEMFGPGNEPQMTDDERLDIIDEILSDSGYQYEPVYKMVEYPYRVASKYFFSELGEAHIPDADEIDETYGWVAGLVGNNLQFIDGKWHFVKQVAKIDMSTLDWTYSATDGYFKAVVPTDAKRMAKPNYSQTRYGEYETSNFLASNALDLAMSASADGSRYFVRDKRYHSASDFKRAIAGAELYYEVATPAKRDVSDMMDDIVLPIKAGGEIVFDTQYGLGANAKIAMVGKAPAVVRDVTVDGGSIVDENGNASIPLASGSSMGLFKPSNGATVSNGWLTAQTYTALKYPDLQTYYFVSKGTLENIKSDLVRRAMSTPVSATYPEWIEDEKATARKRISAARDKQFELIADITLDGVSNTSFIVEYDSAGNHIELEEAYVLLHFPSGSKPSTSFYVKYSGDNGLILSSYMFAPSNAFDYNSVYISHIYNNNGIWIDEHSMNASRSGIEHGYYAINTSSFLDTPKLFKNTGCITRINPTCITTGGCRYEIYGVRA